MDDIVLVNELVKIARELDAMADVDNNIRIRKHLLDIQDILIRYKGGVRGETLIRYEDVRNMLSHLQVWRVRFISLI